MGQRGQKKVTDQAAQPLRQPEPRWRRIRLVGGLMLWICTLYCGPKARTGKGRGRAGSGLYPELALLGFSEGCSPALVSRVGRAAALLPSYALARRELEEDGLHLDVKVVHRMARRLGAEILTTRTRDLQRYRAGLMPVGKELARKRVGVAIDGGRTRTRTVIRKQKGKGHTKKQRRRFQVEWREPKILILFLLDQQGQMVRGSRPWIDGTFAGPDELMELLAMHLHHLGAAKAKEVVFLADGAPWIWERLNWVEQRVGLHEKKTTWVLDFCHAVHHVSLALEQLDLPPPERQHQYRQLRKWLRAGRHERVIETLSRQAESQPKNDALWRAIEYLDKHSICLRLDYGVYRRKGLPIGSGAIESAVRRVINLRLKGNGLLWREENAEAMLVMRAAALTDRWKETLDKVRASMRKDRRLGWQWRSPDMPEELNADVEITPPKAQPPIPQGTCEVAA
jgi:hypothetical protein